MKGFPVLIYLAAFAVGFLLSLAVSHAQEQAPVCMNYGDLSKAIAENYGESPAGSGIMEDGKAVLMIFASPKGDSWTAVILKHDATACVVAHGEEWLPVIPPQFSAKGRRYS